MVEPFTLTMERVTEPRLLARFMAASVSMVSPDCDMTMTRVLESISGSSYRNSDAMDTVTGIRSMGSISAFATIPACMAVPQAIIRTWEHSANMESGIPSSLKSGRRSNILGRMVFLRASGCSWISLSMKWGYPFFMAASMFQLTSSVSGSTRLKSISYTRTLYGVRRTIQPSGTTKYSLV